jgi:hypothetical protein
MHVILGFQVYLEMEIVLRPLLLITAEQSVLLILKLPNVLEASLIFSFFPSSTFFLIVYCWGGLNPGPLSC